MQNASSVSGDKILGQGNRQKVLLLQMLSPNIHIQGVTGGTDQTSGECSLGHTIPI